MTGSNDKDVTGERFRTMPEPVDVDETVEGVDQRPVADPNAGRNVDQDHALRDA